MCSIGAREWHPGIGGRQRRTELSPAPLNLSAMQPAQPRSVVNNSAILVEPMTRGDWEHHVPACESATQVPPAT